MWATTWVELVALNGWALLQDPGHLFVSGEGKASLAAAQFHLTPPEFRNQHKPPFHTNIVATGFVPRSSSPAQGRSADTMSHSPTQGVTMSCIPSASFRNLGWALGTTSICSHKHHWIIIQEHSIFKFSSMLRLAVTRITVTWIKVYSAFGCNLFSTTVSE